MAEKRTYPNTMKPDVSKLVVAPKFEVDISVVLKEAHLRNASARMGQISTASYLDVQQDLPAQGARRSSPRGLGIRKIEVSPR